jgi:predicted sulfurtransferase
MLNNKKIISVFVSLLILGGLFAGGCVDESEISKDVDSSQAVKLMQRYKNSPNLIILDVRTPTEFAGGHLEGAINVNIRGPRFRDEL